MDLLINQYKVNQESILLMVSSAHKDLYQNFPEQMLVFDTHKKSYYDWTYHMPGIYGEGLTFSIKQPDNSIIDVGNLIQIKSDKNILAYEIAYGTECLDRALTNKKTIFDAYPVFQKLPYENMNLLKIIDTVFSVCAIANESVVPNNKTPQGQILKKLYKNMVYLVEQEQLSATALLDIMKVISDVEFLNKIDIPSVYKYFVAEKHTINDNRIRFLQEKFKILQRMPITEQTHDIIRKRLENIAEGQYPISPHERDKYLELIIPHSQRSK